MHEKNLLPAQLCAFKKKSPGWGTIQGIFKMRRVAPRVAPKLLVLIPIKPAGASTKSTYVGAGAGACVRIDWIGLTKSLVSSINCNWSRPSRVTPLSRGYLGYRDGPQSRTPVPPKHRGHAY